MRTPASGRRFRPLPISAAIAVALGSQGAGAATYTVTNASQFGPGSLAEVIQQMNANCPADLNPVIAFNVGTGPIVINVSTFFPEGFGEGCVYPAGGYNVVIDGTTQPGSVPNTSATGSNAVYGVTLDGAALTFSYCPLFLAGTESLTIRGLEVRNFSGAACRSGTGNMTIVGSSFRNNQNGIVSQNAGGTVTVGGPALADRVVISGNSNFGISAVGPTFNITNALIGTDPSGNTALPNGTGVIYQNGPFSLTNSVIAGNNFDGITVQGGTGGAVIANNKIGENAAGAVIPNGNGIRTSGTNAPLTISNNTIRGNTSYGVQVLNGDHVQIANNAIYGNGLKNVSLDVYGGPVPNDALDVDAGPNNRQNFPVVTSVFTGAGPSITVNFTFNSNPLESYTLDFYSNSVPGTPAGEVFLGSFSATTDTAGNMIEAGTQAFGGALTNISMVARRASNGDTSEFSPAVAATAAPAVSVAPASLNFPNVVVGTTSANQVVTLTSTGLSPWQISQISTGSCYGGPICYGGNEFTCMTDCIPFNPYATGASCTVTANFHPTAPGPQSTSVTFCDNATGSPRTIPITGNAILGTLAVTPSAFDFGNAPVNGRSATAAFRVQNPSPSPTGYTATTNGPFQIVGTTCSNPIPGNGSCDFDLAFLPTAAGVASGNLVLNAGGVVNQASLMGTGVTAPLLALPANVDITYTLGSPPAQTRITLANAGTATLDFTSIAISGPPFTLVNNCPTSLPPGSSCDIFVGFSQADRGEFTGTLTIVSNAPGGSAVIRLRGIASPREVPILEVTPREIGYGEIAFGGVTNGEVVKVRNIGGAPAVFDSLVVSPDFQVLSHTCTAPLPPLETCEARVAMRPRAYGVRFGEFVVRSNAENGPNRVPLFGTSCRASSLVLPRMGTARGC